jgi:hypothetical protein
MNNLLQFDAWLTKTQNVAFEEKRDALETIYDKFTKEGDVSEADYRSVTATGLGQMGFTPLGGSNHRDTYAPGTERVTTFKKFTNSVILPEELIEDMYNNGRVKKDKVKLFSRIGDDFLESANWTREVITADFILRGNSTTATNTWPGTFRDGLALCSTSHVTTKGVAVTWSNLQSASAMTQLALLEGLKMLADVPTEEGRPQGAVGDVLLVYGRYNMHRVAELLGSDLQPDTANNTINVLAKKIPGFGRIIPVLNPYLGTTFSGWALIDAKNHSLMRFEKKKPTISKDTDINTGNRINRVVMRYAIDADSAKGIVLNAGV